MFDARLYQRSIGPRCGSSAAAACWAAFGPGTGVGPELRVCSSAPLSIAPAGGREKGPISGLFPSGMDEVR